MHAFARDNAIDLIHSMTFVSKIEIPKRYRLFQNRYFSEYLQIDVLLISRAVVQDISLLNLVVNLEKYTLLENFVPSESKRAVNIFHETFVYPLVYPSPGATQKIIKIVLAVFPFVNLRLHCINRPVDEGS